MIRMLQSWYRRWKANKEARLFPEKKIVVSLNEDEIIARFPEGDEFKASLSGLEKIEVLTNDSEPWGADVWFVFSSSTGQCRYPQGATGDQAVLDYMLALKGFNEEEFIKAMGCTSNAVFLCWQRGQ